MTKAPQKFFLTLACAILSATALSVQADEKNGKHSLACGVKHTQLPQECMTVTVITEKDNLGKSNGIGTAAGAVGGVVVGSMVGDSLTSKVLGGVAGAVAGNYAQRKMTSTKSWDIQLKSMSGKTTVINTQAQPAVVVGQSVRVRDGKVVWTGAAPKPY